MRVSRKSGHVYSQDTYSQVETHKQGVNHNCRGSFKKGGTQALHQLPSLWVLHWEDKPSIISVIWKVSWACVQGSS